MTVALTVVPDDLPAAARDYARAGFEVFPLHADKSPRTPNGMKDATTDEARVEQWWKQWPDALIGCRVPRDVVILDIDPRHGGMATWTALRAAFGPLPSTRAHYSGRGDKGGHIWFKRPAEKIRATGLHAWAKAHGTGEAAGKNSWVGGIDLLHHDHRYTILPPSPHPETHKPYWWAEGHGPEAEPAAMPPWLAELLVAPPTPVRRLEAVPSRQDDSIADWLTDTYSWADLLVPEGWTLVRGDGDSDGSAWRHPNATSVQSATIKNGCLFVYTPNTDFEPTEEGDPHGYTRFRAYAVLEHGGDLSAAAREARQIKGDDGNSELPATLTGGVGAEPRPEPETPEDGPAPLDWSTFFLADHKAEDWLLRPVVARGRQAAVWAMHKTGKSLFSLDVAVRAATGNPYDKKDPAEPIDVIYLDMEMIEADLHERLTDMGYDHGTHQNLNRLHYYLLPNLPPLDTAEGAKELCKIVDRHKASLVVIDTMARVVEGEENSSDTYRAFFNHSGKKLKQRGVALFRLDHAGKDPSRGQRGSSSKGDDVDVIFQLVRTDAGYDLKSKASRISWVPERSSFRQGDEFLTFDWTMESAWPAGTKEVAKDLDELGAALDISQRDAGLLLRQHGQGKKSDVVRAALRFRKQENVDLPGVVGGADDE